MLHGESSERFIRGVSPERADGTSKSSALLHIVGVIDLLAFTHMNSATLLKNRRARLFSASFVFLLYLLSGLSAERWWLALDGEASIWGIKIFKLPWPQVLYIEPFLTSLVCGLPALLICIFSRSRLVHVIQGLTGAFLLGNDVWYLSNQAYFGCDTHGCTAEEQFFFAHLVMIPCSAIGWLIATTAEFSFRWIKRSIGKSR